jgi:hypothetical protein
MQKPSSPTSRFADPFGDEKWTRFPESLTDEKIHAAAADLGIPIDAIDRDKGVVHFKGTHDQENALHDMLSLWAREKI